MFVTAYGREIGRKPHNRIFAKILCPACHGTRWISLTHAKEAKTPKCRVCTGKGYFKGVPRRRINGHGYVILEAHGKTIMEHRSIIEQHLGRALQRSEVVHHINGRKTDNRLENLVVLSIEDHQNLHKEQAEQIRLLLWRIKQLEEKLAAPGLEVKRCPPDQTVK